jgi:POT family proton-dependent oligopeptide transporter
MWERFSYYGMRSLLVLYMTDYLLSNPEKAAAVFGFTAVRGAIEGVFGPLATQPLASQLYGLYTGFVYFTPFFGGILADRVWGQRKTVVIGGLLMALGHFLMASEQMFLVALFFLILGNGAFKPNISTQVGLLYPEGDPRRDGAFTIFYMGINLGAFLSPLVCGTLGQKVGWHYGFGAAGVGMLIGLVVYLWGQKHLAPDNLMKKGASGVKDEPLSSDDWKKVWALVLLCTLNIVFWGVYEQQGNTMQLWADKNTDWNFFGWEMPSTWFQSMNPAMIFAFAPLLNIFWAKQAAKNKEPSSVSKMALGCIMLGAAFIIMMIVGGITPADGKASVLWLVGTMVIATLGELYLSPIGLSLVTKVAPARIVSMMMGMWFLSSFFGNYLAGYLGGYYDAMPKQGFFGLMTALGIIAGLMIWAVNKPLKKIIGHNV